MFADGRICGEKSLSHFIVRVAETFFWWIIDPVRFAGVWLSRSGQNHFHVRDTCIHKYITISLHPLLTTLYKHNASFFFLLFVKWYS